MASATPFWYNSTTSATNSTTSYTNTASSIYDNWSSTSISSATASDMLQIPYGIIYQVPYYGNIVQLQPTPQEIEREREEKRKSDEESRKRAEERRAADKRARELLLEYLDEKNKERLLQNKPLELESRLFKDVRYLIPVTSYSRIKAIKNNETISELCVSVNKPGLPMDDVILTKLLHIRNNEEGILRTANHSNVKEDLIKQLN